MSESRVRLGIVLVAIVYALVLSVGLARPHLGIWDEYFTLARSAGFLETGDMLQVTNNRRPSLLKPPIQYWLGAAAMKAGFSDEVSVRMWSALFAVGTVFAGAWLARGVVRETPVIGLVAALLIASSPALLRYGRTGLLESGQVLSVALTLGAVFRVRLDPRAWTVAGVAAGFGALQKAPLALGLAVLAVVVLVAFGRLGGRETLRSGWFRLGALLAVSLAAFWPVVQTVRFGDLWVKQYLSSQLVGRLAPVAGETIAGRQLDRWLRFYSEWPEPWLVAPVLLVAVLLVPAVRRSVESVLLLGFSVAALCGLYLAGGAVYPRYLLPIVPMLAVVAAHLIVALAPSARAALGIALCLVVVQAPQAWRQHDLVAADMSDAVAAGAALRERLAPSEMAVVAFASADDPIPPTAIVWYADLPSSVRMLSLPRLAALRHRIGRHDLRGTVPKGHFATLRSILPTAVATAEYGSVVLWEAPATRARRSGPTAALGARARP